MYYDGPQIHCVQYFFYVLKRLDNSASYNNFSSKIIQRYIFSPWKWWQIDSGTREIYLFIDMWSSMIFLMAILW